MTEPPPYKKKLTGLLQELEEQDSLEREDPREDEGNTNPNIAKAVKLPKRSFEESKIIGRKRERPIKSEPKPNVNILPKKNPGFRSLKINVN